MAVIPSTLWNRWQYKTSKAGTGLEGVPPILICNGTGWITTLEVTVQPDAGSFWLLLFDVAVAPVAGDMADHSYGPCVPGATGGTIVREYEELAGADIVNGAYVTNPYNNDAVGCPFDNVLYAVLSSTDRVYTAVAANLYSVFARGQLI